MTENQQTVDESCSACPIECGERRKTLPKSNLTGWRFALSSACVFLLPLLLGIIGAACFDASANTRTLAGTLGLIGGMAVTALSCRLFGTTSRTKQ